MGKTNKHKLNFIEKNYFHIEDNVELIELFNALPLLSEEGILILMGIVESEVLDKLKEFEIPDIEFPDIGQSYSFGFFGKLNEKNIAIRFDCHVKNVLIELSQKFRPDLELCSYLFYLTSHGSKVLEYVVDDDLFISRDTIKNDETVRDFCRRIGVYRYCLEEF